MITGMKTQDEHAAVGRDLVWTGDLAKLRVRLGLTRSAMAERLHMSPLTYKRCEEDPTSAGRMWQTTASRLGRFAYLAEKTLTDMATMKLDLSDYVPLHVAAATHGMPQELLMKWHREGVIHAADLGILGLWIHRDDLYLLRNQDGPA